MDIEALASIESQGRFCEKLVSAVEKDETFILLSGETGSGRTVVCEQVVNETDSKMRAVFIPCNKDMQLPRLRELFLQQLLPNVEFDSGLNLADALSNAPLPQNHRILVVVDDVDSVMGAFYNELLQLYEQFLGQNRFAFLLVCHPLWAEEKVRGYNGRADIMQLAMPLLNMEESIVLSRHMFAWNDALRIYNAISNKLPIALADADGNLGKIIQITEKFMKDPDLARQYSQQQRAPIAEARAPRAMPKKTKKSSSVGIFVTAVCIIIVLACLIPIFFGGSFFSSGEEENTISPQVANEGALAIEQQEPRFTEQQYNQPHQRQQAPEYLLDDGILPEKIPEGIEAPSAKTAAPSHSVTLSGEDLDKIEGGANNSEYPRGMERPVNTPPQRRVLQREDNCNHSQAYNEADASTQIMMPAPQVAKPPILTVEQQPQKPQQQSVAEREALAKAAAEKLEADRRLAQAEAERQIKATQEAKAKEQAAAEAKKKQEAEARAAAERKAKEEAQAQAQAQQHKPLRAGQIINLGEEQKQQQQAQAQRVQKPEVSKPAALAPGEGSMEEFKALPDNRYTVQIVSASKRVNIAAAARGLSERYWIIESSRNGKPWYILVSGSYGSREEASAASKNIPRSVSQGATPYGRRMSEVKSEIR